MSVQKFCTRDVVTIDKDASARDAAVLIRDRHVSALVVTRSTTSRPEVAGVVTDSDLVRKPLAGDAEELQTLPAQALARRWRQMSAP